jgi:hypothetical protein
MKQNKKTFRKKNKKRNTRKRYSKGQSGGTIGNADVNLAYPSKNMISNTNMAYTGAGINPNPGPLPGGFNFINSQQRGGKQSGGTCSSCAMTGGNRHRHSCKCSECKSAMKGGNSAFVGKPYTINSYGGNYYPVNTFQQDPQLNTQVLGANRPFLHGGKNKKRRKTMKGVMKGVMKGGNLSNFLGQDVVNMGREIGYGFKSAYNGLQGTHATPSPLPWQGHFQNSPSTLSLLKNM